MQIRTKLPRVNRNHFPPSWKKRRLVEVGEQLRYTDRVVQRYTFRNGRPVQYVHTLQMGKDVTGLVPAIVTATSSWPYGWYYRRVK